MLSTLFAADTSSAGRIMQDYLVPVVATMGVLASLACVLFLVLGGYHYMTSAGKPDRLEHGKLVMRNALIGLAIVIGAGVLVAILTHAYGSGGGAQVQSVPALTPITPDSAPGGLVDVLIKAVTGFLQNIIQSIGEPFIKALAQFTTETPLAASNSGVFKLWLALVGITDALFVAVVALLGFHVMSYATFGLEEIEFKHLLPRVGLIFLLANSSIFIIDGLISLSNAMIHALRSGFSDASVFDVLAGVAGRSDGFGLAALLIMLAFLVLSIILLVYYVGRIVTIYLGAVLAPLVLLVWLIPGFRDFSETAGKTYIVTIFILFVHVVILELASTLFGGLAGGPNASPDPLMALVIGLATLIALLKAQGVMTQYAYASTGPRMARKLGGQFMTGVSYLGGKTAAAAKVATGTNKTANRAGKGGHTVINLPKQTKPFKTGTPKTGASAKPASKLKTGETREAPRVGRKEED